MALSAAPRLTALGLTALGLTALACFVNATHSHFQRRPRSDAGPAAPIPPRQSRRDDEMRIAQ